MRTFILLVVAAMQTCFGYVSILLPRLKRNLPKDDQPFESLFRKAFLTFYSFNVNVIDLAKTITPEKWNISQVTKAIKDSQHLLCATHINQYVLEKL